jgi:stage II sporulation protein R
MIKTHISVNNQSMKKIIIVVLIFTIGGLMAFGLLNKKETSEYLRIHIRANSNSEIDQSVKYLVKDAIVEVMIPFLSECETKSEAESTISKHFDLIEKTANQILAANGFFYTSRAHIATEEFPTRDYNGFVLEKGFYDALILELGEGKGNNWWCVVYPPLCFLNNNPSGEGVIYKSKLVEIIKSILG